MKLLVQYPWNRGACHHTESVLGVITFELQQNGSHQMFRKSHIEPIEKDDGGLMEARFRCKCHLLTVSLPELVAELKDQISRNVFWEQGEAAESLTPDFSIE